MIIQSLYLTILGFIGFGIFSIWSFRRGDSFKESLINFIFTMFFFYGVFQLNAFSLGYRFIWEGLIAILFVGLFLKNYNLIFPGFRQVFIYSFLYWLSFFINHGTLRDNEDSIAIAISSFRFFISAYIFFLVLVNNKYTSAQFNRIFHFILFLVGFQVLFAILKVALMGAQEQIIGTMQWLGGTLTSIFSLLWFAVFFVAYLFTKKKYYMILLLGVLFFAFSGDKRSVWFYLPIIVLFSLYYYVKVKNSFFLFGRYIVLSLVLYPFILYGAFRLIPSLNPENAVGGSFDVGFVQEYMISYNFGTTEDGDPTQRFSGTVAVLDKMTNAPLPNFFLGYGPSYMEEFRASTRKEYSRGFWGRETGINYSLTCLGFLGTIASVLIFVYFFRLTKKLIGKTTLGNFSLPAVFPTILFFVFLIDFSSYSRAFIWNHVICNLFFFFVAFAINDSRLNITNSEI